MKTDFDKIAAFNGSADLQVKAWERFLAAWSENNPYSQEDKTLTMQQAQTLRDQASRNGQAAAALSTAATSVVTNTGTAGNSNSFRDCADCLEMVWIPKGRFLMGSPLTEEGRYPLEVRSMKS